MTDNTINNDLTMGGATGTLLAGLSVEFKRCSGRIEHDVFETICAFGSWFDGRRVQ